ncbi:MAG: hypothetical protein Q4F83_16460 [Eubacteriales bacterium]|nr:hypothetical protein [Eubacteriales bacterium]
MRMQEMADIHSHILPGLDDGCRNMEETVRTLQEAAKQQVNRMIVTPHFHPGRYMVPASLVLKTLDDVRSECEDRDLKIDLYPGQECYYYTGLAEQLNAGNALTLAGSKYVLVEFDPNCLFHYLLMGLRDLRQNGYIPILAHFERYRCLQQKENLRLLKEDGFLLQMNFDTLLQKNHFFKKNPWRIMIKSGIVDFMGSDCHGMDFRPLCVSAGYEWMGANLSGEQCKHILKDNVQNIFQNRY